MSKNHDNESGMMKVNKTELVWPGKYNDDGTLRETPRISLPFQVIETINESRATREAEKTKGMELFNYWDAKEGDTFEEGWRNKLIWGDNLLVMGSLLEKFAGKVDLIYIDPPFATGGDFSYTADIGEAGLQAVKEQSLIEEKAYRDTWGLGVSTWLFMMQERLPLMMDLLKNRGTIYIHLGYDVGHYCKVCLDELLGKTSFLGEVIWHHDFGGRSKTTWPQKHDNLYIYRKGSSHYFDFDAVPTTEYKGKLHEYRGSEKKGKKITDVWNIAYENKMSHDNTGFPTQKPKALLERIMKVSSPGTGLIADFFCGSGTAAVVAEQLGRRWIACDLSRWAVHTTRKRMLSIENCRAFDTLNLGKYERKYWQGVTFGEKKKGAEQQAIFQYIAFILKLYAARPISGMEHIHGQKGKAMVHVGAVDAPVTIAEANACIEECLAVQQKELHILGWEWEMGMNDLIVQEAKQRGVKLLILSIPREVMEQQAVEKGDIRFFEVAHLEFKTLKTKGRKLTVKLEDFAFPYADLIPKDVKSKIKKWSDYIDYWAVDWDFQNDTFINGWVAYRTRKERKLPLESDTHTYEKPGKYTVMVKVIDIFGNDTSKTAEVEVK